MIFGEMAAETIGMPFIQSASNIMGLAWWQASVLGFIGLSAGGVIAAGVFAFLAIIGVFPRIMDRTGTKYILLYETLIILGGIWGNVSDLYELPIPVWFGEKIVLGIFGLSAGIFVGCLVMSLAETLKAVPVLNRRIRLAVGLQYVILSVALGKLAGALIYFYKGMCI